MADAQIAPRPGRVRSANLARKRRRAKVLRNAGHVRAEQIEEIARLRQDLRDMERQQPSAADLQSSPATPSPRSSDTATIVDQFSRATSQLIERFQDRSRALFRSSSTLFATLLGFCFCMVAALGGLLWQELAGIERIKLGGDFLTSPLLFFEVRVVLTGFFLAGLVWFTIRLLLDRHNIVDRREESLRQYELDVERANFLIGILNDTRSHANKGLPDILLSRFSSGLFGAASREGPAEAGESSDALRSLLSSAASLKLGPSGVELEINKAGIRNAIKSIDKAKGSAGDE